MESPPSEPPRSEVPLESEQPPAHEWGEADAALLDAFAVPSYLALFTQAASDFLLIGEAGRLVHLGCRTGHPDASWLERMPRTTGVGVDPNPAFIQVAASHLDALGMRYVVAPSDQSGLEPQTYSHAIAFHPHGGVRQRLLLFREMARLLYPGGQALFALPVGESFQQLLDLTSEYALKNGRPDLESALDGALLHRPSVAQLRGEVLSVGLGDIGIETQGARLTFDSGLAFVTDPAVRLLILPQIAGYLDLKDLEPALVEYFVRAIDKYWSDAQFEVTLEIATVTARR
jgi:SAM-dependent methyltransferase